MEQNATCTQADLARAAGLHRITVAKALRGHPAVSKATRARIRGLARDLGYRPNAAALAMRRGRFGCVAMILSDDAVRSGLPQELLGGVTDALEERGHHLTIARLPDEKLTDERFVPKILREWMSDGLLINYNCELPERLATLVERCRFPHVWINAKRDCDCAYPDDYRAGVDAARRLIALGHRRIAYLSFSYRGETSHYSELDRRDGYIEAMRGAGLRASLFDRQNPVAGSEDRPPWREAAEAILSSPQRPTAMVLYSACDAVSVSMAAERMGIEVPRNLSLIVFGPQVRKFADPRFADMTIPARSVGRAGVEMLLEKIETPGLVIEPRVIPFTYRAGDTLAPPKEEP